MTNKKVINLFNAAWALCLTLCLMGCQSDDGDQFPVPDTPMHVVFNLNYDDDTGVVDPFQHEGSDSKLSADDIDFLFYTTDGQFVAHASGASHTSLTYNPNYDSFGHKYQADVKVNGIIHNHQYRVVVLANWRYQYSGLTFNLIKPDGSRVHNLDEYLHKPAGYSGTDEQYLYDNLLLAYSKEGDPNGDAIVKYTQWNLNGYQEARIPMWGVQKMDVKVSSSKESLVSSGTINLLRSIAKVKVQLTDQLLQQVAVTDHVAGDPLTGMVLNYKQTQGYMTPRYLDLRDYEYNGGNTWISEGQDKVSGAYSNEHINQPLSTVGDNYSHVPMCYDADQKAYYIYLPEQRIGEAYIGMRLHWLDSTMDPEHGGVSQDYKLHFADYKQAVTDHPGWAEKSLTEEQLNGYKFPVMRNHYYIYTIVGVNPLELKFEVCPWQYRSTEINFGYVPSKIEEILGFTGYAFRYTHSGSELRFWVKGSVTNAEATITDVYVDGNKATHSGDEYATGLCYWKSNTVNVRYTVRYKGVDYIISRTETIS